MPLALVNVIDAYSRELMTSRLLTYFRKGKALIRKRDWGFGAEGDLQDNFSALVSKRCETKEGIKTPRAGADEDEIKKKETIEHRRLALILCRPEALRRMNREVGKGHLARQKKSNWTC